MSAPKLAVVVPAGPKDNFRDTLDSVFCYTNPELVIVIDDTGGQGISFTVERATALEAVAHGGLGGLQVNLATAFRYAVENVDFDVLLRLDTDALLLGPGLVEAAGREFAAKMHIGALGAYRFGPDGGSRDWTPARRVLQTETGPRGLRHPALRATLRRLIAEAPGYTLGEHALGGAVLYRGGMLREMYRRSLLQLPEFASSRLGEDHIFGLLTVVAGYQTGDFSGPDDPMAVRWKGLPASPDELLRAGKLVTHSVRSWQGMNESEIRERFAAARLGSGGPKPPE